MGYLEAAGRYVHGMNLSSADLMGKPHLTYSCCILCGLPKQSGHHVVPKGTGNRSLMVAGTLLKSPVFGVCGYNNVTGCHGLFHHHKGSVNVVWRWMDKDARDAWWSGALFAEGLKPHDPVIFAFGCYEIEVQRAGKARRFEIGIDEWKAMGMAGQGW